MKLLCTGDLHLGAGGELGRAPGDRLKDQSAVLVDIHGIAVERDVDGILVAGDVFDGPGIPPEHLDVFAHFVDACHQGGIPILAITGNGRHDAAVRSTNGLAIFQHIPGIQISSTPELVEFAGCAIATAPWVHPGRLIARLGRDVPRDEVNVAVGELLVEIARELKQDADREYPGLPQILLGHWSVEGAALPNGLPVADLREPVIPIAELDQFGYGHTVLGHIHRAQEVGERGFYVGSPLPLNFGETHVGHGVAILDTDERESIDFYAAEYVEIQSRPLVTVDFDCTDETQARWLAAATEHPSMIDPSLVADAIVRFRYKATADQARSIDNAAVRRALLDAGAHVVKIVPDIVRADRARVEGVDESLGTLQALELYVEANAIEPALADAMREQTRGYLEAVA